MRLPPLISFLTRGGASGRFSEVGGRAFADQGDVYLSTSIPHTVNGVISVSSVSKPEYIWNSLPSSVRQATSLTKFRRLLINSDTAFMKNRLYLI